MNILIRSAKEYDEEVFRSQIEELYKKEGDSYAQYISRSDQTLCAEVDEKIIAFVSVMFSKENLDNETALAQRTFKKVTNAWDGVSWYVSFIAVDPNFRRQGVMSRLIKEFSEIAEEKNITRVQYTVFSKNEEDSARGPFYLKVMERNNWEKESEEPVPNATVPVTIVTIKKTYS